MEESLTKPRIVGRYALHGEIARGGMATVHLGRLRGAVGFARTVAIKRLHAQLATDPDFLSMFLDEARIAARIHHPNVVATLDVVATDDEVFLVMDYVHGESLAAISRMLAARRQRIPPRIASTILIDALHGLHAAHEARDEQGNPLDVIHRDVSPQNILVGVDGVARVLDFGVAKALGRAHTTRGVELKGKLSYMAPEQFRREPVTRSADIYAASVVLWEALAGQRLFAGDTEANTVERVLYGSVAPPSEQAVDLPRDVDEIVLRGLARDPAQRFATAREMALALEKCLGDASVAEVGGWLQEVAKDSLAARAAMVAQVERSASMSGAFRGVGEMETVRIVAPVETQESPAAAGSGEPHSATGKIAVTSVRAPRRRRTRVPLWVVVAGTAVVFAGLAAFVGAGRSRVDGAVGAPAASTEATSPSPSPSPSLSPLSPSVASVDPLLPAPAADASRAAAPASSDGSPTSSPTRPATPAKPARSVGRPAPARPQGLPPDLPNERE